MAISSQSNSTSSFHHRNRACAIASARVRPGEGFVLGSSAAEFTGHEGLFPIKALKKRLKTESDFSWFSLISGLGYAPIFLRSFQSGKKRCREWMETRL
jgi:hypothetical protein